MEDVTNQTRINYGDKQHIQAFIPMLGVDKPIWHFKKPTQVSGSGWKIIVICSCIRRQETVQALYFNKKSASKD